MQSETTIHVAIELSVSSWLVARPPGVEKSRLHHIEGGDTTALLALIAELRTTSILVNRRARRAKTDRLDAEGMLRVLAAWLAGARQVCSMVRVPTPEEEDAKRPHREREHLVQERLRIENRIEALLFTQGIRKRPSLRSGERDVAELSTGDGRALPSLLRVELKPPAAPTRAGFGIDPRGGSRAR